MKILAGTLIWMVSPGWREVVSRNSNARSRPGMMISPQISVTFFAGYTDRTSIEDGINLITFDDPNDDIGGSYEGSGTVALTRILFGSTTHEYQGKTYLTILRSHIITQDNASSYFVGHEGKDGEEVFAHELGHSLGLDHPCGYSCNTMAEEEAIMRIPLHSDGRGARIGEDDKAGIEYLYYAPTQVTLIVKTIGNGLVKSFPVGIDCGFDCTHVYENSTSVTLTVLPSVGWNFVGWSDPCSESILCVINMMTNNRITATFLESSGSFVFGDDFE